jgi:hypothetical protein
VNTRRRALLPGSSLSLACRATSFFRGCRRDRSRRVCRVVES